jgi:hypothetical protein
MLAKNYLPLRPLFVFLEHLSLTQDSFEGMLAQKQAEANPIHRASDG